MKKILVACGNGIASSAVAAQIIGEACEKNNMKVVINQCKMSEAESRSSNYDLLVTTGKFKAADLDLPIINAVSLLTGMGEEETIKEILDILKK